MNRTNTLVWLFLIGLTLTTYFLAENWSGGSAVRMPIILIIAGIKFSLVAWWFMELRSAAKVWAGVLLLALAMILGVVAVLA